MSKEKKETKLKRTYNKSDMPTMTEMIDMELSIAESSVSPQTVRQFEQWHESIMRKVNRLFERHSKYMTDNNQTTDALLIFLDKYPELFASEYGAINRDMLKWSLNLNILKNRALIEKIQEIEKELKLEVH